MSEMTTFELVTALLHRLDAEKPSNSDRRQSIKRLSHYLHDERRYQQNLTKQLPETD